MRRSYLLLGAMIVLGILATPATGRRLENWSYERLFKEADLVVIATADAVADSDDVAPFDDRPDLFEAQTTTFTIQQTLKGKVLEEPLRVLHFRLKKGHSIDNGPLLVKFRTKPMEVELKDRKIGLPKGTYLLYLKARKDGRFEPLSGQYDPALSSRELNSTSITLAGD